MRDMPMIAYLFKTTAGFELTLLKAIGDTFSDGEKISVFGKREANAICKARGYRPWNW